MTDAERKELDEYRRQDLLRRMQAISQDQWAAGWMKDLEHDLYLMTFYDLPSDYGMGTIEPATLAELKRLAQLTHAWWAYDEASARPNSISLAEAERRFSKLVGEDESGELRSIAISEAKLTYQNSAASDWELETIRLPWDSSDHRAYRMKSNALFSLQQRANEGDWELRFGKTTLAYVRPTWAEVS